MSDIGVESLVNRLQNVIDLYIGDLSNAEVIGTLDILKMEIYAGIEDEDSNEPEP